MNLKRFQIDIPTAVRLLTPLCLVAFATVAFGQVEELPRVTPSAVSQKQIAVSTQPLMVRIKDIVTIEGDRTHKLTGKGIVVGLNGTGGNDELTKYLFANIYAAENENLPRDFLANYSRMIDATNMARVTITAELPEFPHSGQKVSANVAIEDSSTSLQGGTLLYSLLKGEDGQVYGSVQGKVIVGGFAAAGQAASIQSNNVSSGTVANGVRIERVLCQKKLGEAGYVDFHLRNPDRQTAERVLTAINSRYPRKAQLLNRASIRVAVPVQQDRTTMEQFLNKVQNLMVEPDNTAKIIYNEHAGTIVITANAKLKPVAITFGSLMISTTENAQVSQPGPLAAGDTTVVPRTTLTANENANELRILKQSNSLQDLVDGLNALGVSAREMGNVLINLEKIGALQAELIFE